MAGYKGSNINPRKFEAGQIKIILILLPLAIFMCIPIVFICLLYTSQNREGQKETGKTL